MKILLANKFIVAVAVSTMESDNKMCPMEEILLADPEHVEG